jgi:hypothetical protein
MSAPFLDTRWPVWKCQQYDEAELQQIAQQVMDEEGGKPLDV